MVSVLSGYFFFLFLTFYVGSTLRPVFSGQPSRAPLMHTVVACAIPVTLKSDLKRSPSLDASLMYNQFRQK